MSEGKQIWVLAEVLGGQVKPVSLEALHAGQTLGGELGATVTAVVATAPGAEIPEDVANCGVARVLHIQHAGLETFNSLALVEVLAPQVQSQNPEVVMMGATNHGKELAPALAARLGVGLATDCIEIHAEGGMLKARRPVYAGKAHITFQFGDTRPCILTLRPNVFRPGETPAGDAAPVETVTADIPENGLRLKVKEVVQAAGRKLDITEARIIVSGGMGMQKPENFQLLEELAEVLGAAVGASRPVVDNGWREYSNQVGQTGRTVSPDLYIACGISGAVQHLAGMSSSRCIVAINKDPNAPIFDVADYGIVGDVLEILPVMTAEFKKVLQK
ncbi:Electron transfer flavoprotein, alpha subunit [Nitrospina gracilis 3/211]|uniref:Electron transfer flavoprotein subunit alpha n=1 Tax=Nitrospina gracilis (strain 3/211) TaxID=1266370 RepID=M1YHH0_NITG3|nr:MULTISPECIES: electron transfer flavoprotein subunit alpha/FixB family protein [Nitrospina]MCF8722952.1 electron transfer flavoprotein alpha subunit [Nitrospina sp. Nb-3]CCQ89920.1 Electron transfer flavoprotein, alpha subunit [Nitrospina gracilis 3/211]